MHSHRKCGVHVLLASGLTLGVASLVHAQAGTGQPVTRAQGADVPAQLAFEVATVKPIDPNALRTIGLKIYPGSRVVIPSASLKGLVTTAFGLSYWQVSTCEAWMENEEYDVVGKPPENLRLRIKTLQHTLFGIEDATLRSMLQALLIDRFQLRFHRERRSAMCTCSNEALSRLRSSQRKTPSYSRTRPRMRACLGASDAPGEGGFWPTPP